MSFASILWLVVAKLATGNEDEASETASANNDEDEAPHTLTKVTTSIPIEKKANEPPTEEECEKT